MTTDAPPPALGELARRATEELALVRSTASDYAEAAADYASPFASNPAGLRQLEREAHAAFTAACDAVEARLAALVALATGGAAMERARDAWREYAEHARRAAWSAARRVGKTAFDGKTLREAALAADARSAAASNRVDSPQAAFSAELRPWRGRAVRRWRWRAIREGSTMKSASPNQPQGLVPSRDATVSEVWVVWSNYHDAWWGPDHSGYTTSLLGAGFYTEAEARSIAATRSRERGAPPPEVAIPLLDALHVERRQRTSGAKVGRPAARRGGGTCMTRDGATTTRRFTPKPPLAERVASAIERISADLRAAKGPYLTVARFDVTALRALLEDLHAEVTR